MKTEAQIRQDVYDQGLHDGRRGIESPPVCYRASEDWLEWYRGWRDGKHSDTAQERLSKLQRALSTHDYVRAMIWGGRVPKTKPKPRDCDWQRRRREYLEGVGRKEAADG